MKDSTYIKVYCVVESNDKVMMTKDTEGQPGWKFPGGHVDQGELLVAAGIREVKEETGYDMLPTKWLVIEDFFNRKRPGEHNMRMFLIADLAGGTEKLAKEEVEELRWFSPVELAVLKQEDVYPPHWSALQKYLSGTTYPLELIKEVKE